MNFRVTAHLAAALFAGFAAAQDLPAVLYHVQENTVGCANPMMTRALTDPRETRRKSDAWLRETMAQGRCVSVTPQSPWKLVSLDVDVALMSYMGSVGPPGAYYMSVTELIDSSGRHPSEAAPPAPAVSTTVSQAQTDPTSATALAPNSDSMPDPAPPAPGGGVVWVAIISGIALLAVVVVVALQRRRSDDGTKV